jgi:hypothetical protein
MADIAVVAAQVAPIDPEKAEIYTFQAAAALTAGEVVYVLAAGTVGLADATTAGGALIQARGIALNAAAIGKAVDVLKKGRVAGFTVAGVDASKPVFLSETPGALADATPAGTGTAVVVGVVVTMPEKDATKVLFADFRWGPNWA